MKFNYNIRCVTQNTRNCAKPVESSKSAYYKKKKKSLLVNRSLPASPRLPLSPKK